MEIKVTEKEVLAGDISQLKTIIDKLAHDGKLSAENENNITIKFDNLNSLDLSVKLQKPEYKRWFKKLDNEFHYLPFFLNKQSKTLMFFIMGNVDFTIEDQAIVFNESSKQHFVTNKKASVKAFCLSHNIDMTETLQRLTVFEPQPQRAGVQKVRVDELLSQRGAVAYMSEQREYTISIFIKKIPKDLKIHAVYYTEKNCPQPFFTVFMEEDGERIQYTVYPQISQRDTDEYLLRTHEVKILIAFKINDQLKGFPKITENIKIATLEELQTQQQLFLSAEPEKTESSGGDAENRAENGNNVPEETGGDKNEEPVRPDEPEEQEDPDKTLPIHDVEETPEIHEETTGEDEETEETVPENETCEEKAARLEKENAALRRKVASQQKIIDDLEEEINKKRSIWSFIKRMFG